MDNVLMFEVDSSLCKNPDKKYAYFSDYDYIGAPWEKAVHWNIVKVSEGIYEVYADDDARGDLFEEKTKVSAHVGNSGLSFRKKESYLKILKSYIPKTNHHITSAYDFFTSCAFKHANKKNQYNLPSLEQATNFSVEGVMYKRPFGYHKPWQRLNEKDFEDLENSCPNLRYVRDNYKFN